MQINPIFSSFPAVENIELDNKSELIKWSKEEINFDSTTNYKSPGSNHPNTDEPIQKELKQKIEQGFNNLHKQLGLSSNTNKQYQVCG